LYSRFQVIPILKGNVDVIKVIREKFYEPEFEQRETGEDKKR